MNCCFALPYIQRCRECKDAVRIQHMSLEYAVQRAFNWMKLREIKVIKGEETSY